MGRISKGQKCSVVGCGKDAIRSISLEDAKAADLQVEGRRAYLCEDHYKSLKKKTRKARQFEKWRYGI